MPKKYICEVKRDWANNELELIQTKLYDTVDTAQGQNGTIKFSNAEEMKNYFKDHCIAYDDIKNNNQCFVVLFWILLFILIGMLLFQMMNNKDMFKTKTVTNSVTGAFGRFRY